MYRSGFWVFNVNIFSPAYMLTFHPNSSQDHSHGEVHRCMTSEEEKKTVEEESQERRDITPDLAVSITKLLEGEDYNSNFSRMARSIRRTNYLPNYYLYGKPAGRGNEYAGGHVVFLHYPKSGGSSVKYTLTKIRRQRHISLRLLQFPDQLRRAYDLFNTTEKFFGRTIFEGIYSFGICEVLHGRPCAYFTLIRDPIDRMISMYFYCQQRRRDCRVGKNVSVVEWALKKGSQLFRQITITPGSNTPLFPEYVGLYRDLSTLAQDPGERIMRYDLDWTKRRKESDLIKKQRRALLDYCINNMEHWFAAIGITEEFDLSLQMFEEVYKLPIHEMYMEPRNTGKIKTKKDESLLEKLKDDLLGSPDVMEALHEDMMIYMKGRELFRLQKGAFEKERAVAKDSFGWLVGWLFGWLVDWLDGWLVHLTRSMLYFRFRKYWSYISWKKCYHSSLLFSSLLVLWKVAGQSQAVNSLNKNLISRLFAQIVNFRMHLRSTLNFSYSLFSGNFESQLIWNMITRILISIKFVIVKRILPNTLGQNCGNNVAHLNVCSLLRNVDEIRNILTNENIDILSLSETRLDSSVSDAEICIPGYWFVRLDRNRNGGGILTYIKENIPFNVKRDLFTDGLELLCIEVCLAKQKPCVIVYWYRPPDSNIAIFDKFEALFQ